MSVLHVAGRERTNLLSEAQRTVASDYVCRHVRAFLDSIGIEAVPCSCEDEARSRVDELAAKNQWPCFFFESDTTGEKDFEEFFMDHESVDWDRFAEMGVVRNEETPDSEVLRSFDERIRACRSSGWTREDLVNLFHEVLPDFGHKETGRFLDGRM